MGAVSESTFLKIHFNHLPQKKKVTNLIETAERLWVHGQGTPFPGKHRFDKTPYMIEPAQELSNESDTEEVVIMKSAQGGATANSTEPLILSCVEGQGKILAFTATETLAKAWKSDRLDPMLESSGLYSKLSSTVQKNNQHGGKGDAGLSYTWPGGRLDIKTYAQIKQIRQISYQFIILEEEEEEANAAKKGVKQGLFRDVAYARTGAFQGQGRKILRVSTPLVTQTSVIYPAFLAGDQRHYYVPCIHCGAMQYLDFHQLKYKIDDNRVVIDGSVHYECKHCHGKIYNKDKPKFIKKELCYWKPHNKKARPGVKSYTFSALYYPVGMETWEQLAQQWVDAQGSPDKLQTFANLKLGEPFDDYTDTPAPELLHALKGDYHRGTVPVIDPSEKSKPLFSTMGCDVQAGNKKPGEPGYKPPRIEASLYAWGINDRCWLLEHYVFEGAVTDWTSGAFKKFSDKLQKNDWPMQPVKIFIDSGHQGDEVNKFCNRSSDIHPIRGYAYINKNEGSKYFKEVKINEYRDSYGRPLSMYELSTNIIKRRLYNNLVKRRDEETGEFPNGSMSFPVEMDNKFFKQITAEVPRVKKVNNRITTVWDAGGRANECLDCYVYADIAKELFINTVSLNFGEETSNTKEFWNWAQQE